jgi:hypothetical protein
VENGVFGRRKEENIKKKIVLRMGKRVGRKLCDHYEHLAWEPE